MKKITLITLALFSLLLTQCKKEKIDSNSNSGDVKMVQVKCEVPISNGSKTDFTNLFTDGTIKWSEGTEYLYFPVNGDNPYIASLSGSSEQASNTLTFTGELPEDILIDGSIHEIWYLGTDVDHIISNNGTTVELSGSIGYQSGKIEDLGKHHIAKGEVKVNIADDGSVSLLLKGRLKNQIAIAYMDLTDIKVLEGSAIIGTRFAYEYSDVEEKYVFNVNEDGYKSINITEENPSNTSFVVLFPNIPEPIINLDIITYKNSRCIFKNGIEANGLYYAYDENNEKTTLNWETFYNENGYEYVDLGLSVKWAKYNIGVDPAVLERITTTKEDYYGDYFIWSHVEDISESDNISELHEETFQGMSEHDAATANWGGNWVTPNKTEMRELLNKDNCDWVKVDNYNGVSGLKGFKVISKKTGYEGRYIFLPAAGYYQTNWNDLTNNLTETHTNAGERIYYWTADKEKYVQPYNTAWLLKQDASNGNTELPPILDYNPCKDARSIRPVYKPN